ncbi:MAG: drug/metabolite transporter (DMT)-like permease [Gammaproteobacteria bacterium]
MFVDQPWTLELPDISSAAAVIALGVFSTGIAYLIFFRILAVAGATNIALVTLLLPVSAILLGWLFLSEIFLTNHFVGMDFIAADLVVFDGRRFILI